MAPPSLIANGGGVDIKSPVTSRVSTVYSEVQNSRLDHPLSLPSVFDKPFKVVNGPPSSAAGNPGFFFILIFIFCIYMIESIVFYLTTLAQ